MRNAGVWVGILLLIFAGTLFWQSLSMDYYSSFGPGPGFFPIWLSGFLIFLSILYMIESIRKDPIDLRGIFPKGAGLRKVISIFASLIIFLIMVPFTGYTIAGVVMMSILFFREYKWYWGIGISVVVTLILFFAFESFLNVPLPVNSFGI